MYFSLVTSSRQELKVLLRHIRINEMIFRLISRLFIAKVYLYSLIFEIFIFSSLFLVSMPQNFPPFQRCITNFKLVYPTLLISYTCIYIFCRTCCKKYIISSTCCLPTLLQHTYFDSLIIFSIYYEYFCLRYNPSLHLFQDNMAVDSLLTHRLVTLGLLTALVVGVPYQICSDCGMYLPYLYCTVNLNLSFK